MGVSREPQVVIVGAGAAGVGAGMALKRLGVDFLIIEAKDRVGGRAFSESASLGHLWDHGCHWFHSADINPLREIADRIGHGYAPRQDAITAPMFVNGRWDMESKARLEVWDYLERVAVSGRDVAASAFMAEGDPLAPVLGHWMKLMTSAEPQEVSALDYGRFEDTHVNLRVRDGYGALIARLASALPIRLGCPASWIAQAGSRMRVETPEGIIAADAVIVTASVNVLKSGAIRFSPALPEDFAEALAAVPCGTYEKMAVAVNDETFSEFGHVGCEIVDPQGSEPLNMEIGPFGRPIAIGHIAGHFARDLAAEGEAARIDFFIEKLVSAFGASIRGKITGAATTGWTRDPFIRGGYASARPGKAAARDAMIEADLAPLLFAGEAFHPFANATAHGAYLSGQDAALKAARGSGKRGGRAPIRPGCRRRFSPTEGCLSPIRPVVPCSADALAWHRRRRCTERPSSRAAPRKAGAMTAKRIIELFPMLAWAPPWLIAAGVFALIVVVAFFLQSLIIALVQRQAHRWTSLVRGHLPQDAAHRAFRRGDAGGRCGAAHHPAVARGRSQRAQGAGGGRYRAHGLGNPDRHQYRDRALCRRLPVSMSRTTCRRARRSPRRGCSSARSTC